MEYSLFVLALSLLWKFSSSIKCYRCEPEFNPMIPYVPLCQHFNYSKTFQMDCTDSTICYKKETSYSFGSVLNTVVERGCAPQILSGDQERTANGWKPIRRIYEVYNESCTEDRNDDGRVFKSLDCYCRGDFCNGTPTIRAIKIMLFVTILMWMVTNW